MPLSGQPCYRQPSYPPGGGGGGWKLKKQAAADLRVALEAQGNWEDGETFYSPTLSFPVISSIGHWIFNTGYAALALPSPIHI